MSFTKSIHTIFALISILLLLLASGCTDQDAGIPAQDEVMVPVVFGMTRLGEQDVNTSDNETAILSLRLLVFDARTGECQLNYYTVDKDEIDNICKENKQFLTLSGDKNIVAIANEANNGLDALTSYLNGTATLTFSGLKQATATTTVAPVIDISNNKALFMSGETQQLLLANKTASDPNRVINLYLDRACAKISVTVTKSDEAAAYDLKLKKLTLIKGSSQFKVMADPYQYNKKDYATLSSNIEQNLDLSIKAKSEPAHTVSHLYSYERYVADEQSEATYLQLTVAIPMGATQWEERTATVYLKEGEFYNLIRNTQYNLTVNIKSVDISKLEIQCSITPWTVETINISSRPTSTVPLSNCYIVKTGSTINIPVAQANADGTQRIGVTDELEGVLVWDNTAGALGVNSQIQKLEVIGVGSSALLSVKMGGENGNAAVAIRNKTTGAIRWSWHIWVTDYDPDAAMASFSFERGTTLETGGNSNIAWHLHEETSGAGGKLYMYMYHNLGRIDNSHLHQNDFLNGLNYQWGRKDPIGAWGGTIYLSFPTTTVTTLEGSIESPNSKASDPYFGAAAANKDLWEPIDGTKSVYDPCPIGWRVPSYGDYIDKVAAIGSGGKQWWLSSFYNDTQRWSYDINKYNGSISVSDAWPIRCISEATIMVPPVPERAKVLKLNWNQGIINPLGNATERGRTIFSVAPSYVYTDDGTVASEPAGITYSYTWYVDNSPQTASASNEYTHTVSRFNDQSILLKCRVVDSEGRVAETTAEWMVMKRAFQNASLVTFNNAGNYLAAQKIFILEEPTTRSRVRYLRAPGSSNVYRVKLMSDGYWWMVQDYREGTVISSDEGGYSLYSTSTTPCPTGWEVPTTSQYNTILSSNYSNMVGMDETNGLHFEAQVNTTQATPTSRYLKSSNNGYVQGASNTYTATTNNTTGNYALRCRKTSN